MTEEDFINIFGKYNLYDALSYFSKMSYYIFSNNKDERNINGFAYLDTANKIAITQSILAYFTNMLLISGSNEYKSKEISKEPRKIFQLASDYSHKLPEFSYDLEGLSQEEELKSMFIGFYYEQTTFQFRQDWSYARTLLLYEKLLPESFLEVFKKETGLGIREFLFFSILLMNINLQETLITAFLSWEKAMKEKNPDLCNSEKLQKYLNSLSCDYEHFRDLDREKNENYKGLSRLRFNPLRVYPLIKVERKYLKKHPIYVIPNYGIFWQRSTEGLFWFFIDYYSQKDKESGIGNGAKTGSEAAFRGMFGEVFKKYVGCLLQEIYGKERVTDSDREDAVRIDGKPLGDWCINLDDKLYVVEVKSRRYNRLSQSLDIKALDEELNRFIKNAKQVYDAVQKIQKKTEAANEARKHIIPVLINYEIPYLSLGNSSRGSIIKTKFQESGMADLELYYSDIYGLERCFDVLQQGKVNLEDVCLKAGEEMEKRQDIQPGNNFLEKVFRKFTQEF